MRKRVSFSLLCMLCITPVVLSGVQTVKNITFTLTTGTVYYAGGQFLLSAGGSGDLQTYDAAPSFYNYSIENIAIAISPCVLKENKSTVAGKAIGDFWGGGVLTVTGDLMQANNGDPYGGVLYSGVILVADMVKTSAEYWTLSETATSSNFVTAATGLAGDDGGLHSGITFGSNTMLIGDMTLKLQFYTPGISTFGASNIASTSAPVVQIAAALPEPATLLLLAVGGLGLISRKVK